MEHNSVLVAAAALALAILAAGYWYREDCSSEWRQIERLKRIRDSLDYEISWQQNQTASLMGRLNKCEAMNSKLAEEIDSLSGDLRQASAAARHYRKTLNGEGKLLGVRITTPLFSIGAAVTNPFYNDNEEPHGYLN